MRQLTGMDEFHLMHETPSQHMHTIKIAIVDPAQGDRPITYASTRESAARRFLAIPPLRCRLVRIPFGLARPFWADVGELDLDYHVRRAAVPAPGRDAEFDEVVSDIANVGLDRSKPLWQLWFVEGLEGGKVALVFKMHHSIADGFASVRIFEDIFSDAGESAAGEGATAVSGERIPSRLHLLALGLLSQLRLWAALPRLLGRTRAAMKAGRERKAAGGEPAVKPLTGPMTRFSRPITPNRVYVNVTLPLNELRRLHGELGCTVNDIFVTLCGGALRRYLEKRAELPDEPMTAAMPVSIRREDEMESYGNRISYWYVALGTEADEPLGRLASVRRSIQAAREWNQGDLDLPGDWEDFTWLFVRGFLGLLTFAEHRTGKVTCNATVSNVHGPRPLVYQGAPVLAVRSMGPIEGSRGINFTAWSYGDDFAIGIQACREHAPDLRELADHLAAELVALETVAPPHAPKAPSGTTGPDREARNAQ